MCSLPFSRFLALLALSLPWGSTVWAWDYAGHRTVNQLALAGLPTDFPAFARTPEAAERIAFLAGEPDRWRNAEDLPIKHYNSLDHYCDLEQLDHAGLDAGAVSPLRYEFAVAFARGREAHLALFPAIDPAKNADHSREWCGFLPWTITEYYGKLKSAFSYLKTFQEYGGTPVEIAEAQANIVYLMGVMGHYVGDGSQPLHVSMHHNGWVGDNPHGYTTSTKIHSLIDGGFIDASHLTAESILPRARPAAPLLPAASKVDVTARDPMFDAVMGYLRTQAGRVEPLYVLEKDGGFAVGAPATADGKAFIEEQLLRGGAMLSSIWLTAWQNTAPDSYLKGQLIKRGSSAPPPAVVAPVADRPSPSLRARARGK